MTHPAGTSAPPSAPFGYWVPPDPTPPPSAPADFRAAIADLRSPVAVVRAENGFALARGGTITIGPRPANALPVVAYLPPLRPDQLGDPTFLRDHALKYPYMTGAMANGIGSVEIVEAMSRAGMLGSFGAAGLSLERITPGHRPAAGEPRRRAVLREPDPQPERAGARDGDGRAVAREARPAGRGAAPTST